MSIILRPVKRISKRRNQEKKHFTSIIIMKGYSINIFTLLEYKYFRGSCHGPCTIRDVITTDNNNINSQRYRQKCYLFTWTLENLPS